jgi:hypothetical protein
MTGSGREGQAENSLMRIGIRRTTLVVWALAGVLPAAAEEAAPAKGIEAEVVAVAGEVTAKRPGQNDFTAVKVGDRLPEKAEISTGLNSECRLKLPNAELKVEALTTTAIDRLRVTDGGGEAKGETVDSKVNLKFGTVKFKVQKGALKTDMKISTPNSTTAISGTAGGVSAYADQPDLSGVTEGGTKLQMDGEDYGVGTGEETDSDAQTRLMRLRRWLYDRIYWVTGGTDGERDGGLNTGAGGTYYPPTDPLNGSGPYMQSRQSFESQPADLPQPPTHP